MKGKIKNITSLYGKAVESTAGKTGYVISVNAGSGKIQCLICADENENEFAVDVRNIVSVANKIIYEDRESAINDSVPVRLGIPGYDLNGAYLGALKDITLKGDVLGAAIIGKKKYSAADVSLGDAAIVKNIPRTLKENVVKDGRVILKRGAPLTEENLQIAREAGVYVQTNLKTI